MILVAGLCLGQSQSAAAEGDEAALEYKVEAGYLFNFAKFVEWPAAAYPAPDCPFIIAVADDGEASPILEKLFAGKSLNGHAIQVRRVSAATLPREAHILVVTRRAGLSPEQSRAAVGTAPILLVGETEKFAERGGAIAFVWENESVRLTLCLEHAAENGLKISAKLSSVARSVRSTVKR